MKVSRYLAIAIPFALATAGVCGVASAEDAHGNDVGPVSVFCNNAFHQSLVDAGGGNGGLLGQVAKGLGIGLGGPGSIGEGNRPGSTDLNPPPSNGDNEGGDGRGTGLGANNGSADGGNGGHVEESSQQVIAGNRCATGPESHVSQHKDVNVYDHSFNSIRKEKSGAEHR